MTRPTLVHAAPPPPQFAPGDRVWYWTRTTGVPRRATVVQVTAVAMQSGPYALHPGLSAYLYTLDILDAWGQRVDTTDADLYACPNDHFRLVGDLTRARDRLTDALRMVGSWHEVWQGGDVARRR